MRHESDIIADQFRGEQAAGYDGRIRTGIPGYDALHDCAAAILESELDGTAKILVVGVGTGEEVVRLSPRNPGWHFVGVDPAGDMLAIASERVAAVGAAERVEMVTGIVADLPTKRAYDAATLLFVMHFLTDDGPKLALLTSIADRLRPGAPLVLADLHGDPTSATFATLLRAWKKRMIAAGANQADVSVALGRIVEDIAFVPEGRIYELLQHAGFDAPVPFWRGLLFGGWLSRRTAESLDDGSSWSS